MRGRLWQHNNPVDRKAYTASRLPVTLVWAQSGEDIDSAISFERQIKGWSRRKKETLIRGNWDALPELSKRGPA